MRPRDVPGYAQAAEAGVLPRVTAQPPTILSGRTAGEMFIRWAIWLCVMFFGLPILFAFASAVGISGSAPTRVGWILLPGGLVGFWLLCIRHPEVMKARHQEELQHGYTTEPTGYRRTTPKGLNRGPVFTGWDFAGTWVLNRNGTQVISAPNPDVDAPGFYPSPNRPGSLELWTGGDWFGKFREYPAPLR
jgi:hypothetical protein